MESQLGTFTNIDEEDPDRELEAGGTVVDMVPGLSDSGVVMDDSSDWLDTDKLLDNNNVLNHGNRIKQYGAIIKSSKKIGETLNDETMCDFGMENGEELKFTKCILNTVYSNETGKSSVKQFSDSLLEDNKHLNDTSRHCLDVNSSKSRRKQDRYGETCGFANDATVCVANDATSLLMQCTNEPIPVPCDIPNKREQQKESGDQNVTKCVIKTPRKRKQLRPKSICRDSDDVTDDDEGLETEVEVRLESAYQELIDNTEKNQKIALKHSEGKQTFGNEPFEEMNAMRHEIKQRPLCSKLCIKKSRRKNKPTISKLQNTVTNKTISDIINETKENSNIPCTTNRYRRHFLKQLRKAEAKRKASELKDKTAETETEKIDERAIADEPFKEDSQSEDEYLFDGRMLKADEVYSAETTECNICLKTFDNVGTFMAHYMCHSSFEKEQAGLRMSLMSRGLNSELNSTEGGSEFHMDKHLLFSSFDDRLDDQTLRAAAYDLPGRNLETLDKAFTVNSQFDQQNDKTDNHSEQTTESYDVSTYFCHICNQRFTNINSLQSHVTEHVMDITTPTETKRDYYCHLCHKKFASAGSLHVHNKIHTGDTPYSCLTCNKSFRDKTRLTTHMRVHTGEKPFNCNICYKSFSQKGNLKLHQKIHTGERDSTCNTCGNSFRTKSDLLRHMKVHGATESISDFEDSCSQKATTRRSPSQPLSLEDIPNQTRKGGHLPNVPLDSSSQHAANKSSKIRDILDDKTYLSYKPYAFPSIEDHFNKHISDKDRHDTDMVTMDMSKIKKSDHELSILDSNELFLKPEEKDLMMSIDSEVEFIKAMTKAKLTSENTQKFEGHTFKCPLCELTLSTIDNLNHHILSRHNPLNSFSGSSANSLTSLSSHIGPKISHGIKKFYRCRQCSLEFTGFPAFQTHMKSHLELETMNFDPEDACMSTKCTICGVNVDQGELVDHMKKHSTDKVYSCDLCVKVFRRSHHLQTHMRTHTGDRPYICTDCGKCFSRGDHLQNHRRTHTGEKPYRCDVCNKTYSQSHHLLRHKRTHTGERPYKCVMCVKTFSRDHHLKKHMETHKVVVYTDKPEAETPKRSPYPQHTPSPYATMVTRSSNRIAQLMSAMATNNPASRLMESMVKKHLQGNMNDNSDTLHSSGDYASTFNAILEQSKEETNSNIADKTLKISDILEETTGPVISQISNKLILDHVLKVTKKSKENTLSDVAQTARAATNDDNEAVADKRTGERKEETEKEKEKDDGEKHQCEDDEENKNATKDKKDIDIGDLNVDNIELLKLKGKIFNPPSDLLTLEDIVNKRLMEEYDILTN